MTVPERQKSIRWAMCTTGFFMGALILGGLLIFSDRDILIWIIAGVTFGFGVAALVFDKDVVVPLDNPHNMKKREWIW